MAEARVEREFEVRRHSERGSYDRSVIEAILDEAMFCTVAFVDTGQPVAIPTIHARDCDRLLIHGSVGSRMMRTLASGAPCCVSATLLDGLVLARSAFNHSMNYRSVVLFGSATIVDDDAKEEALRQFTEKLIPGRWSAARPPSPKELRTTMVVAIPIESASAKVRSGPPEDEPEDMELEIWAGVIPYLLSPGPAIPAPEMPPGTPFPDHLSQRFPSPA